MDFEIFLDNLITFLLSLGKNLIAFAVVLIVGYLVAKYVTRLLRKIFVKSNVDLAASGFICSVVKVAIMIITFIIAISELGINLSSAVTALGAAGLTASFALQGSLSNFVSGIQLIFSRPFKVDDFLAVNSFSGSVKEITILSTTLMTPDNKEVIIPNSIMTTDVVINFSSQTSRRLDLVYSVDYSTDLDKAKKVVSDTIATCEGVLNDPEPVVAVGKHLDSSVEIVAQIWIEPSVYWNAYFYMQENVKKAFDKNDISIPFPQLDVHTK